MFSDISAQAQENFSGARIIRAYVQENAQRAAFETSNREYIARSLKLVQLMGMLFPTLETMLGLGVVLVLWLGGREVLLGHIKIGKGFVTFNLYMMQLTWPIIALGWVLNLYQRGTASLARIDDIFKERPSISDTNAAPELKGSEVTLRGDIEFRDLNFNFDNYASQTSSNGGSSSAISPRP